MPRAKNMNPETPNDMNEIVTYAQAKGLKAAGFNEQCNYYYPTLENSHIEGILHGSFFTIKNHNRRKYSASAPSIYVAAAWLRRNGWHVQPMLNGVRSMYFVRVLETVGNGEVIEGERQFEEYEDALSHGIDLAIKRMTR